MESISNVHLLLTFADGGEARQGIYFIIFW